MSASVQAIIELQQQLQACRLCPDMMPPVVVGEAVVSPVLSIGQAPGDKEGVLGKPFAWTAGKTLFKWLASIGVSEEDYRSRVYMAAVCRCFPGKNPKGGDRVPAANEIAHCRQWLEREVQLLRPELVIPIGKLAINELIPIKKLTDVIGQRFEIPVFGIETTVIPLPHPSGASTWHRTEPGKRLLTEALALIEQHPAWRKTFPGGQSTEQI